MTYSNQVQSGHCSGAWTFRHSQNFSTLYQANSFATEHQIIQPQITIYHTQAKMSFSRIISRKALPLTRTRLFTTTPLTRKSAIDTAKETIEDLNKKAGQSAAAGIEKGRMSIHLPLFSPLVLLSSHSPRLSFQPSTFHSPSRTVCESRTLTYHY